MSRPVAVPASRQTRLLREFGLIRYRLRAAGEAGCNPRYEAAPAPTAAGEVQDSADALSRRRLLVCAGMAAGRRPEGAAGEIWAQVLAWLRLDPCWVEWCELPGPEVLPLPPPADWLQPMGKRELWRALKSQCRGR